MTKRQEKNPEIAEVKAEPSAAVAPPPMTVDALLAAAGRWATMIGAVIGFTYVAGYIIVNLYLGVLGIRPPNFIASRYLATGLVYLFVTVVPVVVIMIGFWPPGNPPEGWGKWKAALVRWGRALICVVFALLFIAAIASFITGAAPDQTTNGKEPWEFWFVLFDQIFNLVMWSVAFSVMWSLTNPGKKQTKWWSLEWYELTGSVIVLPLVFAITCAMFAGFAYPHIRPGYGGGASTPAQLMIDPHSDLTTVLPMSDRTGTTAIVALVDQNDDGYIVWLTTTQQIIVVPRDAVRGVIVKPSIAKPSPLFLP